MRRAAVSALLRCILVMVVALMLGLSGARIALQEERAARNDRDRKTAFQAAEAALLDAQRDIEQSAGLSPRAALLASARGLSNDQPPTVEDVEEQFLRIVALSELKTPPERMAKELGVLAHQVQLLSDPSVTQGVTSLREYFETYTDGRFRELVVSREPFWAAKAPLDPRPPLLRLAKVKFERHGSLAEHFDAARGRSIGHWDELSVPYAQMQLSFSTGVNATANMWTLLWRAVGDRGQQELPAAPWRDEALDGGADPSLQALHRRLPCAGRRSLRRGRSAEG